jgi:hypothetical protein
MSAGWVAGSVRARAMTHRRVGADGARNVAASASLSAAVDLLARSPYGERVRPGDALADAARGVRATVLWNLRVLAGWLPGGGAETVRALAGWFEIANVDEHLRALDGHGDGRRYELGSLGAAWPLLAGTGSREELRTALTASRWGDPGGDTARDIQLTMRLSWATRVASRAPAARDWALGGVALVLAKEMFGRGMPLPAGAAARTTALLGPAWTAATTLDGLRATVPTAARWALAGVADVRDLWRAETAWWRRVRADGSRLSARSGFGPDPVVGTVALLAADAWLVLAGLETAARTAAGDASALEAFDVVA